MDNGRDKHSQAIRERSGSVDGESRLQCFLYLLLRDPEGPSPGEIESIMRDIEDSSEWEYSNGYLADYAKDIEERLLE